MRYEEIEGFLAIIEHGSITKAADSLYITQPTLSHQIVSLEKELGVPLLIRKKGNRQVTLTPAGKAFIIQAEKWKKLWLETKSCIDPNTVEKFRVATANSISYVFKDIYRRFATHNLPCSLFLSMSYSTEMYERINLNDLDMALLCNAKFFNDIISEPIAEEKLVFLCGHNSSYEGTIHPQDLDVKKEIYSLWNNSFLEWHSYWFQSRGNPPIEVESTVFLEELLNQPETWAIVPISVAESSTFANKYRICPMIEPPPARTLYTVTKKRHKSLYHDILLQDILDTLSNKNGFKLL